MRRVNQGIFWAAFLLLAGLFLLLKNLQVIEPGWGAVAWGGIFAVVGLSFLVAFLVKPQHWWRAIPGFTLLSLGLPLLLAEWQKIDLGQWQNAVILFGVALGFWAVLLVQPENWWAEIPAGVLTLLGLMTGFQSALREPEQWLVAFSIGLGVVFGLLYILRARTRSGWWPAVPAAALILFGVVTWIGPLGSAQAFARWWPVAMMVAGLLVLVLSLQRLPTNGVAAVLPPERTGKSAPAPDYDAIPPAPGASVTETLPAVDAPLPPARPWTPETPAAPVEPAEAPKADQPDIYETLKQQPPEAPQAGGQ